ncbi:MAG: response regulator, partial [Eubacterium sp.]|nr:response regulator [Eubacterium sp.]
MMERILIVEDDKNIRELIRMNLQLGGYHCTLCRDGKEMEESLSGGKFDLILLDVMLPGLSGFDLIGRGSGT